MIVVFGGAFQGKKDFIIEKYNISESQISVCSDIPVLDFSCKAIYGIEKFVKAAVRDKINPIEYIIENKEKLKDKIIVCEDICCGIVPLDFNDRLFRDNVGKILQILCRNADEVYRIYCGIGEKLK